MTTMSIHLLDTNHMSILERESLEAQRLETRLSALSQDDIATTIVSYDEKAAAEFERPRQAKIRIGTMDLKIAAIALANNATLLTRNLSDFGKVPDLRAEDWSA
jgi:tRNA(fMet)-specific endonuclease VapC